MGDTEVSMSDCNRRSTLLNIGESCIADGTHRAAAINLGDSAFLLRMHLLQSAKTSIIIQTFLWQNDECGRFLCYLALQAAKRGVRVKVLVDCWPGLDHPPLLVFLGSVHPNIEVKF